MLHLWRNPRDGYFYLRNGQRRRTLGTKDPDTAHKLFKAAEKAALNGRLLTLEGRSRTTLEHLRDRYLATRGDKAADTIAADKNSFRKAVGHFGGTTLLSSIKREQVRQFITALKESGES